MKVILDTLKRIYIMYKQPVLYLFFGACTILINTVSYWRLYDCITLSNIVSTILAWLVAVVFAFVTNKVFVFESKRAHPTEHIKEAAAFFGCRLLTGILDVAIMTVTVNVLKWNGLFWKLVSNLIVTIINYVASKFLIFKKS